MRHSAVMAGVLRHATGTRILVALVTVLAVLALVLSYAGRAVLRSGPFADRATAALRDSAVQAAVADHLTGAVVGAHADLAAIRPLVRGVAGAIVSSGAFAAVFHRAVLNAHAAVVSRHRSRAVVDAADAAVLIQGVLQHLAPGAAATAGAERAVALFDVRPPRVVDDLVRVACSVYSIAWALALTAILLAALALWSSGDRGRCVWQLGVALTVGGLLVVALYVLGTAVIEQTAPAGRGSAAAGVWRALAGGLRAQALWFAGAGAVVAGAAWMWRRGGVGAGLKHEPTRSLVIAAVGAVVLLEPGAAVGIVAVGAGLLALGTGVAGFLRWMTGPGAARARSPVPEAGEPDSEPGHAGDSADARRRLWPAAVAVGAVIVALVVIASGGGDEAPAATPLTCEGSALLCGRHLDDVALPATHNSFASVTIPTFLFGQQDGTIAAQLAFGIRGFLIDTYYGFAAGDRVRTDTASLPKRTVAVQELGEPAVKAAEGIRKRLASGPAGARGIYLCHGFCELGAVPLASALADLRSFLIANPGEVVVIINQDEGPTPDDIAAAFERAGLSDLIYRGPLGPFPTLRQMIDSGQRLVVMAENDAGNVPWYHLAYRSALQETPFRFRTTAALTDAAKLPDSCTSNRGPASAPLFLLNHWIDTTPVPRASNAAVVNAHDVLLRRAETCRRLRHRLPNLIAVDFFRRGDVVGVARTLNGLAG